MSKMSTHTAPSDYGNGKIYVIKSPNCDKVYYGSTVETLQQRFNKHKTNKVKSTSDKIVKTGGADIFLLEAYPCSSIAELEDREATYILNDWDGCVNKNVPGAKRRAGGTIAYNKKRYHENPAARQRILDAQKTPEAMAKRRAYERNSVNRSMYRKTQIECVICNKTITNGGRFKHRKTKRCQKFLQDALNVLMDNMISQIEQAE